MNAPRIPGTPCFRPMSAGLTVVINDSQDGHRKPRGGPETRPLFLTLVSELKMWQRSTVNERLLFAFHSLIFCSAGEDFCSLLMLAEGWKSGAKALAFHTGHVVLSHLTWQSSQKRNRGESQLLSHPPPLNSHPLLLPVELLRWDEALLDSMPKTVACVHS